MKKKGRKRSMKKLKEVARLFLDLKLGVRPIARACSISTSTAHTYVNRLKELALPYEELSVLGDDALEELFFPGEKKVPARPLPDYTYLSKELTKKGVTLQLLHEEYRREHPEGYERSRFFELYHDWLKNADPVMRFTHKAGEKLFVDFSGDKPHYQDPTTGALIEAEFFVAVLGASSYLFALAVADQKEGNFIGALTKSLEWFGGCPELMVLDNAKVAVTHACYYEPELNKTFAAWAEHYGIGVIPTRVAHPRDNAKAENGVLQAQRRILAALRNRTFFSLHELNDAIREEAKKVNERVLTGMEQSRYDLFLELDKPALRPLPERYVMSAWKKATVHIDYHVDVEKIYYSVPYTLIGREVDISYTYTTVVIYHKGTRMASHMRVHTKGAFVTDPSHMPHRHRNFLEWTPERIKRWGEKIGSQTKLLMEAIMEHRVHPEHGFRSCLGIIRLAKLHSPERVEQACSRALELQAYNYKSVKSLLENKLENVHPKLKEKIIPLHDNVRGRSYYGEADHD
jgi:transposase